MDDTARLLIIYKAMKIFAQLPRNAQEALGVVKIDLNETKKNAAIRRRVVSAPFSTRPLFSRYVDVREGRVTARTIASEGPSHAYQSKSYRYFANPRADFVERLPHDATARVLEVGCGTGVTGALALARGRAGYYAGIELFPAAAEEARQVLSEVVVGDIERLELPWQPANFDALILSEVLEHLVEPWAVLEKLARVVRPGATILASSPNVAHWRVLRELLHGRFELADQGVFDRTHMRWFTPASYAAMFERAGFAVTEISPVTPFSDRTRIASRLLGGRFDHLFMTQISIEAVRR